MTDIRLEIIIHLGSGDGSHHFISKRTTCASLRVLDVVKEVLVEKNVRPIIADWQVHCQVYHRDRRLVLDDTLAQCIPEIERQEVIVLEVSLADLTVFEYASASGGDSELALEPDEDDGEFYSLRTRCDGVAASDYESVCEFAALDEAEAESAETEVEALDVDLDVEAELEEEAVPEPVAAFKARKQKWIQRHATVRYYSRMNPSRMYPLLVVINRKGLQAIEKQVVEQRSSFFRVKERSVVVIEPVLPGCACYPPRQDVRVGSDEIKATFYVVPQVLGEVLAARIVLRQGGDALTEIPLTIRIANMALVSVMGLATLTLPLMSAVLKHFHIDFASQLEEGFDLYLRCASWVLTSLSPEGLASFLLASTGVTYLYMRPRKRDVFWDIDGPPPAPSPERPTVPRILGRALRFAFLGSLVGSGICLAILALAALAGSRDQAFAAAPTLLIILVSVGTLGGAISGTLEEAMNSGTD